MHALSHARQRIAHAGAALAIAAAAAAAVLASADTSAARGRTAHHPPRRWVRTITNTYLPMRPGAVWVYRGVKDGQTQVDTVRVTGRTRMIAGAHATAVRDVARHGATVLEQTTDWYAQDRQGNVWYLGEATRERLPNGTFDTSGSWLSGVHGARPGIVMTAHPSVDDAHRQEYWPGHAEDQYWLVDLHQRVSVPFVTTADALRTFEWSRLEPGVIDQKSYVRGIGVVQELAVRGPKEVARLVSYTP
jgi:hypothetical protein